MERYRTVAGYGRETILVKKSKFIASVDRAESEPEALEFIKRIKGEFRDATHNTYAYQIGEHDQIQRYSDDGEPSGTAGVPILEVIKNLKLKNTVVVVTRYFGGTLLGASGLIRAYGQAAKEGLHKAGLVERVLHDVARVTVDYSVSGKIENEFHVQGLSVLETDYTDRVTFLVLLPPESTSAFEERVADLTAGTGLVSIEGQRYVDRPAH